MVEVLANALVPVFVGLLFGYAAGLRKIVDNKDVKILVTFLMRFALPCSLFVTIASASPQMLRDQATSALILAIVYLVIFVATYYASRSLGKDTASNSAVLALTLGFPNAAAVGFPLMRAVYGPRTSVTVAVALAIGAITITPITLAVLESGTAEERALPQVVRIRRSVWGAVKNPVFWAPVLGALVAFAKISLPNYLNTSLSILGGATEGAALFVTGVIASAQPFKFSWGVGGGVMIKNVVQPVLCLLVASSLFGLQVEQTKHLVLQSALPCGFFGILFGESFDATPEVASSSLIASTVLSIFTLSGWIILLSHLH
jgi:malonate transporter